VRAFESESFAAERARGTFFVDERFLDPGLRFVDVFFRRWEVFAGIGALSFMRQLPL
jgi:hypothetical protein